MEYSRQKIIPSLLRASATTRVIVHGIYMRQGTLKELIDPGRLDPVSSFILTAPHGEPMSILDREKELLQIEMETRQAKVLELYSKGLTQTEIAQQLGLRQSTISKDLKKIRKKKVKKEVEDIVSDDLWDYGRYMSGTDAALKKMWEVADDKDVSAKSRIEALALILDYYDARGMNTLLAAKAFKFKGKDDEMYGR